MFVFFIIITVAIAVLTTIYCQPVLREEDRLAKDNRSKDVFAQSRQFIILSWVSIPICIMFLFMVRNFTQVLMIIGFAECFEMALLGWLAYRRRGNYYTIDDERLTFNRNDEVEWSHSWDEIEFVHRRIVSTGKTTTAFLDVICKDGTVHKRLPNALSRHIRKRRNITHYPINWKVLGIVLFVILTIFLVTFFCL